MRILKRYIFIWISICALLAGCSDTIETPEQVLPESNPANNNIVENEEKNLNYIGNKNSNKFHTANCSTLPAEENRILFDTRDDAINADYEPCKKCNP